MDEMIKFREETSAKMKSMQDANRNKVLNLLTDEQKKFLESGKVNPNPAPAPAK